MRILVVQESDWIGRNPVLHHRMLESLARNGDEVRVLDFDVLWAERPRRPRLAGRMEVDDCRKFFDDANVKVIRPGMVRLSGIGRISWLIATYRELVRQFETWSPDLVVAYGISNALVALRLARRYGCGFVYHLLDALHTLAEPKFLRPIAKLVETTVLRRADRVIVVNRALRDYAARLGRRRDIEVIPMGSNVSPLHPEAGEEVRRRLEIAPDQLVIMFMGWLYRFSGLRELVRELAARRDDFANLRLLVVGDGDLLPELQEFRKRERLDRQMILTGRRPFSEMPAYLAAADICLLPAHKNVTMRYIVPAKVLEYMESGKPVIATRLRGLQAEFGDLPGLLYIDRPEEVLDHVGRIMQKADPRATARELGRSCLEFMKRRETWPEVTARFAAVLHGAARQRISSGVSRAPQTG